MPYPHLVLSLPRPFPVLLLYISSTQDVDCPSQVLTINQRQTAFAVETASAIALSLPRVTSTSTNALFLAVVSVTTITSGLDAASWYGSKIYHYFI